MKNYLLSLCFLFVGVLNAAAQDADISQKIKDYKDPDYVLISKARLLLYDKLTEGNIEEAAKINEYMLAELENEHQLALTFTDKILVDYYISNYDAILSRFENIESFSNYNLKSLPNFYYGNYLYSAYSQTFPVDDNFYPNLLKLVSDKYDTLANTIQSSDLSEMEKSILQLYLHKILLKYDDEINFENMTENEVIINNLSEKFLTEFPNSKYDVLIKKYIRSEFYLSNFGYGFEFYTGFSALTNNLSDNFTNPAILGFALDFYYKKFVSYIRLNCGFNKNRYDIPFGDEYIWEKRSSATIITPELHFGYQVFNSKYIAFAPFGGIGGTFISPSNNEDYPEYKKFNTINAWTFGVGAAVDVKLWRTKQKGLESSYGGIRLRYTYHMPQFDSPYNGRMHTVTIGFAGLSRILKRK